MCLKNIQNKTPVFNCNFDDGKCSNGNFNFNQSTVYALFSENQLIAGTVYRITDVTSISINLYKDLKSEFRFFLILKK